MSTKQEATAFEHGLCELLVFCSVVVVVMPLFWWLSTKTSTAAAATTMCPYIEQVNRHWTNEFDGPLSLRYHLAADEIEVVWPYAHQRMAEQCVPLHAMLSLDVQCLAAHLYERLAMYPFVVGSFSLLPAYAHHSEWVTFWPRAPHEWEGVHDAWPLVDYTDRFRASLKRAVDTAEQRQATLIAHHHDERRSYAEARERRIGALLSEVGLEVRDLQRLIGSYENEYIHFVDVN